MIYTTTACFRDYVNEHVIPEGCDLYRTKLMLKKFKDFFGLTKPLAGVTKDDLRRYVTLRYHEGVKGPSIRRELCIYFAACNHAVNAGRIEKFAKIKAPRPGEPRKRFLTSEECEAVMAAAKAEGEPIYRFFAIALETAARARAIEELQVGRVDFRRGVVDFRVNGARYKNKRRGEVAISVHLLPILEEACAGRGPQEYVIGCNREGRPLNTVHLGKKVMRAAGIDEAGVCRHVCRKTWASHAAINDVPMKKIATVLHDRVETVDKHYSHLSVDDVRESMNFRKPAQ